MYSNYNDPPKDPRNKKSLDETMSDKTPRREGGDDSLAESSPTDTRSDEKVIVNEQRENKVVNAPAQTAVNTSESNSYGNE